MNTTHPLFNYYVNEAELDQLTRQHDDDAGYDIRCADHIVVVPARESVKVHTGLHVAIPSGYVGFVKSRSGHAFKHNIEVGAGVIDASYRGEVMVLLHNHGDEDVTFAFGERIAQMVLMQCYTEIPNRVDSVESLGSTDRGENGFGSTGV